MTLWYEVSNNVASGVVVTMAVDDNLFVGPNVMVVSDDGHYGVSAPAGQINSAQIYGSIYGSNGLYAGDGANFIHVGVGGSVSGSSYGMHIYGSSSHISNEGNISGSTAIDFVAAGNVVSNSGTISSNYNSGIYMVGGVNQVVNSGTIMASYSNAIYISSVSLDSTNTIDNSGTIASSVGYSAIYTGDAAANVTNSGHIIGGIFFGNGNNFYDGTLGSVTGTVTAGTGTNDFSGGAGKETFDLSYGTDTVDGGGGNDTFVVGANFAHVSIDGGNGTDTVTLNGATTLVFTPTTMVNVEKLTLKAGYNYTLTTHDTTVAAGQTLTVDGSALSVSSALTFNGAAETNGHFVIIGGKGADKLTGGALPDTFVYSSAAQSTSTHYDTITGFNFGSDIFDTPGAAGTITGINTTVTGGTLSTASFDANLTTAVTGHLTAHHAILFKPNAGTLSGATFLVVDLNGTAGYQTGADLVIRLNGSSGAFAAGGFH